MRCAELAEVNHVNCVVVDGEMCELGCNVEMLHLWGAIFARCAENQLK